MCGVISKTIRKEWDDDSNAFGARPGSIELKVYKTTDQKAAEGLTTGLTTEQDAAINWTEVSNPDIRWNKTTDSNNYWTATISGLERTNSNGNQYYYKVQEAGNVNYKVIYGVNDTDSNMGYSLGGRPLIIDSNLSNYTYRIQNQLDFASIEITKIWDDENNEYGFRPTDITLQVTGRKIVSDQTWTAVQPGEYRVEWKNN